MAGRRRRPGTRCRPIKITSPAHTASPVDVQATTSGGTSTATAADKYTYTAPTPAPTITPIAPTTGTTAGGTVFTVTVTVTVTVTGTGLTGATTATFDGTPGTALTVLSASGARPGVGNPFGCVRRPR